MSFQLKNDRFPFISLQHPQNTIGSAMLRKRQHYNTQSQKEQLLYKLSILKQINHENIIKIYLSHSDASEINIYYRQVAYSLDSLFLQQSRVQIKSLTRQFNKLIIALAKNGLGVHFRQSNCGGFLNDDHIILQYYVSINDVFKFTSKKQIEKCTQSFCLQAMNYLVCLNIATTNRIQKNSQTQQSLINHHGSKASLKGLENIYKKKLKFSQMCQNINEDPSISNNNKKLLNQIGPFSSQSQDLKSEIEKISSKYTKIDDSRTKNTNKTQSIQHGQTLRVCVSEQDINKVREKSHNAKERLNRIDKDLVGFKKLYQILVSMKKS